MARLGTATGKCGPWAQVAKAKHYARKWRPFRGSPAPSVSEARAAVRGRPETDWYRVFKRDDSIDMLARAARSGAAHDGATEEMIACAESAPGAASIGVDVAMISGKVCRPSRLVLPYNSYQRRCSNTSPHPHIVHRTPHTCHDTRAQRGPRSARVLRPHPRTVMWAATSST